MALVLDSLCLQRNKKIKRHKKIHSILVFSLHFNIVAYNRIKIFLTECHTLISKQYQNNGSETESSIRHGICSKILT